MNYPQTCTCIPNTAGVVYHNLGCPFASGYSIPYTVPSAPLPIPADLRAAPDWPARVAAVEHMTGCPALAVLCSWGSGRSCACDRDARIGRKIAAALTAYEAQVSMLDDTPARCRAAAARAFEEAT